MQVPAWETCDIGGEFWPKSPCGALVRLLLSALLLPVKRACCSQIGHSCGIPGLSVDLQLVDLCSSLPSPLHVLAF